jgi:hypothetical protein
VSFGASLGGDFKKTEDFLKRASGDKFSALSRYGQEGVNALASATPTDTGETANSWTYEIIRDKSSYSLIWSNTNVVNGRPVAILLQYGHGTGTGGFVQGSDYINPALRPIFDRIANEVWKLVTG